MRPFRPSIYYVRRLLLMLVVAFVVAPLAAVGTPRSTLAAIRLTVTISGAGTVREVTDGPLKSRPCTSPNETPTGTVWEVCAVDGYGWGWIVELQPDPGPGFRFDSWVGIDAPKPVRCDTGRTDNRCRFQMWESLGVQARFVDDAAPETEILDGPAEGWVTSRDSASFSFQVKPTFGGNQGGHWHECQLDGGGYSRCSSPKTYEHLGHGRHTFRVRAVDASGNRDPSPASRTWTVDTEGPIVVLTKAPPFDSVTNSTAVTFEFTTTTPAEFASFTCTLDGSFTGCSSPKSYSGLSEGVHQFSVNAQDGLGNWGTAAHSRWTVDTTPPGVTITRGPAPFTSNTDASFAFESGDASATLACSLDGAAFVGCASPRGYSDLTEGAHTVEVRATDRAGNATSARHAWTIDATDPTGAITKPAAGAWLRGRVTVAASAADTGAGVKEVAFQRCAADGGECVAIASPVTTAPYQIAWDTTGLAGSYALRAVLADGAGNTTASTITIRVDNAAPTGTVAIDAGAAVARNPAVTLALSAVDPAPGSGVRQMRFTNGGATTWSAWEPVATTKAWSLAAGDGTKTVAVQVKDAAGNVATFRDGIRLDTVKPSGTVTIDQGATTTASRAVTLTLTATDPTPASGVAAMRIRNAGGTWSAWQPVATSAPWTLTAGAGSKRVDVQVRDKAGNLSAVASDAITFEP